MTPRARSTGVRPARKEYAPRNLKAPLRWSISGLSNTEKPSSSDRALARSNGVRTATDRSVSAAARMDAMETNSAETVLPDVMVVRLRWKLPGVIQRKPSDGAADGTV